MNMNNKEKASFWKKRNAAVAVVICFVAVIAMVGTFTFNKYEKQMDEQVAKAEKQAELSEKKVRMPMQSKKNKIKIK